MKDLDWNSDDTLQERVAKAIYGSMVAEARTRVERYDLQLERLRRVFSKARNESDRSAAILIFALAEDIMLDGFKANMNPSVSGGWKAVVEANGILATASDRIMLLQLLFWTRNATCQDLRILKSIRNRFAHHSEVDSFSDTKIRGWISSLSPREAPTFTVFSQDEVRDWRKFNDRELYLMRSCASVTMLATDLAVGPAARSARVSPIDVEGGSFDSLPENLKEARKLVAEVFLEFFPPRES